MLHLRGELKNFSGYCIVIYLIDHRRKMIFPLLMSLISVWLVICDGVVNRIRIRLALILKSTSNLSNT